MSRLESRVSKLEAAAPLSDGEVRVFIIRGHPWCSVGLHSPPLGYLRGYDAGLAAQRAEEAANHRDHVDAGYDE